MLVATFGSLIGAFLPAYRTAHNAHASPTCTYHHCPRLPTANMIASAGDEIPDALKRYLDIAGKAAVVYVVGPQGPELNEEYAETFAELKYETVTVCPEQAVLSQTRVVAAPPNSVIGTAVQQGLGVSVFAEPNLCTYVVDASGVIRALCTLPDRKGHAPFAVEACVKIASSPEYLQS